MGGSPAIGICDTTSIKQRRLHAGLRRDSCSKASSTAILTDKGRGERGYLLGRRVSGGGRLLHLILRHRLKGRELVCWRGLLLASQPQQHINIPPRQRWRWIATLEQATASLWHRCPARPTPRKAVSGVRRHLGEYCTRAGVKRTWSTIGSEPSRSNISTGLPASPAARMCAVFSRSACHAHKGYRPPPSAMASAQQEETSQGPWPF